MGKSTNEIKEDFIKIAKEFVSELKKVTKEIKNTANDIFAEEPTEIKEEYENIEDYYQKLELCSLFTTNDICKILAELMGIYEYKNFSYETPRVYFSYDDDCLDVIANTEKYQEHVDFYWNKNEIKDLELSRDMLVLADFEPPAIKFYHFNKETKVLEYYKETDKFPYIREFIDYVISYRMKYSSKEHIMVLTKKKLKKLMLEYVQNHIDDIETKYKELDKEDEQNMEKELEIKREKRRERLKAIINDDTKNN